MQLSFGTGVNVEGNVMQNGFKLGLLSTALFASSALAAPEAAAPPVATLTFQEQFDAGGKAIVASDWPKVLEIYTALEARLLAKLPNSKSLPIVQLRKSRAQIAMGKGDEAESVIVAALAKLDSNNAGLRDDRAEATLSLGVMAARRFDYPGAVAHFRAAIALSDDDPSRIAATMQMAQLGMFVDPDKTVADLDAAIGLVKGKSLAEKTTLGVLRNLRGRTLLNLGRIKEARSDLGAAVTLLGGLTTNKFDLRDAAVRSDAAIAALRAKDFDSAREFLAYAGVGQQAKQGFLPSARMDLPECGGVGGPKPDDVAVIEFSIKDDGSIGYALPIYYSGQRASVATFAKAVTAWYWSPEELKRVDKFFRYQTRVEMRCTSLFSRPDAMSLLQPDIGKWVVQSQIKGFVVDESVGGSSLDALKAALANREREFGANSIQLLLLLSQLSNHPAVPSDLMEGYAKRAYEISLSPNVPAQAQAFLGLDYWKFLDRNRKIRTNPVNFEREIGVALARPVIANDPDARGALLIALFDSFNTPTRAAKGRDVLMPLAEDASRSENDPFKVGALIRLANIEYNAGKVEDARALFAKSGLSAQQCALVDAKPSLSQGNITSNDYPVEALAWGFAGWTTVEFDIGADGHTLNQRPVVAWPPFVFGDVAAAGIRKFTYQQTYRPAGGLGCGGQRQGVRYALPDG